MLCRLIEAPAESLLFNCGHNRGFSVLEVLDAGAGVRQPHERIMAPRRAGDPAALVADNRKITEAFTWQPRHGHLDHIVRTALDWERGLADRL